MFFFRLGSLLIFFHLLLIGCGSVEDALNGHPAIHDRFLKLSKEDYKELLFQPTSSSRPMSKRTKAQDVLPEEEVLSDPLPQTLVSLQITENIPPKELFLHLAQQVKIDLEISPDLPSQGVTFIAQNKPLPEVIDRLVRLLHLRYTFRDGVLYIERDLPYLKTYPINFLLLTRESENRISIATDVFGGLGKASSKNIDNGSNTIVTSQVKSDFWGELEITLKTILSDSPISPSKGSSASYTIHRQAGLLSVHGTKRHHKLIQDYLRKLKEATSGQVLIEAKVVEVTLNDQYKNGINWRGFFHSDIIFAAPLGDLVNPPPFIKYNSATQDVVTLGAQGHDMSAIFHFIKEFGTVRTLSSPRLTVMNNHPAILKVAENQVYFRIKYDQQVIPDTTNKTTLTTIVTAESEIQTVPIGLVMTVQPSIDFEKEEVILTLRPTITRVTSTKNDPAVSIVSSSAVKSEIPIVEVREMDSILRVKSGGIAIMGGLMQERAINDEKGIPGLSDMWLLGSLFKAEHTTQKVTELVIFLRATILEDPEDSVDSADQHTYVKYTKDPHPLPLKE